MASSNADIPVLHFGEFSEPRNPLRSWVLWPALAWQVIGPRERPRTLNVFQRAVLGMLTAGRRAVDEIAPPLGLHRELTARIFVELEQMGALDSAHRLLPRATQLLAEVDEAVEEDLVVGHVFVDPFQGDLWPRLIYEDLRPLEVDARGRWPEVEAGTQGRPLKIRPFCVEMPERPTSPRPTPEAILEAARAQRRRRGNSGLINVASVACLDRRPTPYYLLTRVHDDGIERGAEDPFGPGESERLLRLVEQLIRTQRESGGRSPLDEHLRKSHGAPDALERIEQLQGRAVRVVEDRLGSRIRSRVTLMERLVAMLRAHMEASAENSPHDKRDDVLVKAQRATERLLAEAHTRSSMSSAELSKDAAFNATLLNTLAGGLGFATPLPAGITRAATATIRVGGGRHSSVRESLAALLLSTWGRDWPALRAVAHAEPLLLNRIDVLAAGRNHSAHDSDRKIRLEAATAATETVLRASELFLNHLL